MLIVISLMVLTVQAIYTSIQLVFLHLIGLYEVIAVGITPVNTSSRARVR